MCECLGRSPGVERGSVVGARGIKKGVSVGGPSPMQVQVLCSCGRAGPIKGSSRAHWRSRRAICELALTCLVTDAVEAREPVGNRGMEDSMQTASHSQRCAVRACQRASLCL